MAFPEGTAERDIIYDSNGFPASLLDWRREPQKTWQTARKYNSCLGPKGDNEIRAADAYHHVLPGDQSGHLFKYMTYSNKYCPATRVSDGAHVMVQLGRKGSQGQSELSIARYLSTPERAQDPQNHTLPVLDEIEHLDMTFLVYPLLHEGLGCPWYHNYDEAFDAMIQSFEAVAYLHKHRIAHCDLGVSDFLLNYGGSRYVGARKLTVRLRETCFKLQDFGSTHFGYVGRNKLDEQPFARIKNLLQSMSANEPAARPLMHIALQQLKDYLQEAKNNYPARFSAIPEDV